MAALAGCESPLVRFPFVWDAPLTPLEPMMLVLLDERQGVDLVYLNRKRCERLQADMPPATFGSRQRLSAYRGCTAYERRSDGEEWREVN